jgi:D-alanyl-D-alanine carboxypeptidase (penicillin-binding protein 5/6)
MKHPFARVIASLLLFVLPGGAATAQSADAPIFETRAPNAYVLDLTTGDVLLEKNADVPLPPASMSKLMTINMLFEALEDGRVSMDTRFGVSSHAKAMGGSSMFLDERDNPTVEELIKGVIVLSGNDATVVIAEGLAGSEEAFARRMTERARELGMTNTNLTNASGWPDPGHRMSLHDLGILAERLITEFPQYYHYFAMSEFAFDGRAPKNRFNRNPLLSMGIGADGLKTGHTQAAGYGLIGSAVEGDRRIVFVISGLDSEAARAEEARRIVNWAFRSFVKRTAFKAGAPIATAPVWLGAAPEVDLVSAQDIEYLAPAGKLDQVSAQVVYQGPMEAPIGKGEALAELVLSAPGLPERRIPLHAARDVKEGGAVVRLKTAAGQLFARAMSRIASF